MQLTDLQSTSKDDTALVQAYTYIALFRGRTRGGISTFALPRLPYVYPSLATVVLRCEDILDSANAQPCVACVDHCMMGSGILLLVE